MSNTVYLSTTDAQQYPREDEFDRFFQASGTEYAAKACIPLYWLCLFKAEDIHLVPANVNGFDDDSREFPYLLADRRLAIQHARERLEWVRLALDARRVELFEQWLVRLGAETHANVLVRTEQLDWMQKEGELQDQLRKALTHLDQPSQKSEFRMSNAMRDICGLWADEALSECEAFELVGSANGMESWPQRFVAAKAPSAEPKRRAWWRWWERKSSGR